MNFQKSLRLGAGLLAMASGLWSGHAGAVDLADVPVATARSASVKPNIMILMDTSTSMGFTHMPDGVEGVIKQRIGYVSYQCNALYYNPTQTYALPHKYDKSNLPEPSFTAAPYNYYIDYPSHDYVGTEVSARTRNLSTAFQAYDQNTLSDRTADADTPQAAYYWRYTPSSGSTTLSYDDPRCQQSIPVSTAVTSFAATTVGGITGTWTKVVVGASEQTNFARWYSYYRTRMSLMKSGLSLAFTSNDPAITDKYRVGLISMNPYLTNSSGAITDSSTVSETKYEPLRPFDNTQASLWFSKLFAQVPNGASPAREGLSRVGRHYANNFTSINRGMNTATGVNLYEHSCQQNFTIMTTDGYWNTSNETTGPLRIDQDATLPGGAVGQQDGTLTEGPNHERIGDTPRGIWDGNTSGIRNETKQYNVYRMTSCSTGKFLLSTETRRARITQLEETNHQVLKHFERYVLSTVQNLATTRQYFRTTDQWRMTQIQRKQTSYQRIRNTVQLRERVLLERGGGANQLQSNTQQQKKITIQSSQTDTEYYSRQVQYRLATTQRSTQTWNFTATTERKLKQISWLEKQVEHFQTRTKNITATTRQTYVTKSQRMAISWRYVAYFNEGWNAMPNQAACQAYTLCRVADLVAGTRGTSIPTVPVAVPSCTDATPSAGNNYLTTNCSTRYLDGNGNTVGSATPIAGVCPSYAPGNDTDGVTNAICTYSDPVTNPATSCTVGTNPSGLQTTACPAPTYGSWTGANINSCSAYPSQSGTSPFTITECQADPAYASFATYAPTDTCAASGKTSGNDYVSTLCRTRFCTNDACASPTTTATSYAVNVASSSSCTAVSTPIAANSYRVTTCTPEILNNQFIKVGQVSNTYTCVAADGSVGPAYTKISNCAQSTPTAVVYVQSCAAGGNTNGETQSTTSPYTITKCTTASQPATAGDKTACVNQTASAGNNWLTKVCTVTNTSGGTTITNTPTNPATCAPVNPTSSPWNYTECGNSVGSAVYVSSACTPITVATQVGGKWITRTCNNVNDTATGGVGVQWGTCVAVSPTSANNYLTVQCPTGAPTLNTGWVNAASCNAQTASAANQWLDIQCRTIVVGATLPNCDSGVGVCQTITNTNAFVNSCAYAPGTGTLTGSGTDATYGTYTTYLNTDADGTRHWCTQYTTGPTPVQLSACTVGTVNSNSPNFLKTTCTDTTPTTSTVPLATCADGSSSTGSSPNWLQTTCFNVYVKDASNNDINNSPVAPPPTNCAGGVGTTDDGTTLTTCARTYTPLAPVVSCTVGTTPASAANNWTFRDCPAPTVLTDQPVASCAITPASSTNNYTAVIACPTPRTTGPTAVQDCTGANQPQAATSTNSYTTTTCAADSPTYPTAEVGVQSCTPGYDAGTGLTTVCRTVDRAMAPIQSCTNGLGTFAASSDNNWMSSTCRYSSNSTKNTSTGLIEFQPVDPLKCAAPGITTASFANQWTTTECAAFDTSAVSVVDNCTASAATSPLWEVTRCVPQQGNQQQYSGQTERWVSTLSGSVAVSTTKTTLGVQSTWTNIGSCSASNPSSPPVASEYLGATGVPSPATIAATLSPSALASAPELSGCAAWGSCLHEEATSAGTGSSGSLADVAQYYYVTDLKPNNVSTVGSIVPQKTGVEDDRATYQHMTTFAIGLGVSGNVPFQDSYKSVDTGSMGLFRNYLTNPPNNWPVWPNSSANPLDDGTYNNPSSIDDFWHAAVNGRGQYFSAGQPAKVISGLGEALLAIDAQAGAGSGATTSTLAPVTGDNSVYVGSFTTRDWTGELQSLAIDVATASTFTENWKASTKVNASTGAACDNRNIYVLRPANANKLAPFSYGTYACDTAMAPTGSPSNGLTSAELSAMFGSTQIDALSQFSQLAFGSTAAQKTAAAASLVNYLRGQRGKETYAAGDTSKLFRTRKGVLGTFVGSTPAYVKAPSQDYADDGYLDFKNLPSSKSRTPMIYVGGNDGMLHAFDTTGAEKWAYVPSMIMPNMYKLADVNYNHLFLVDGSPTVADVYDSAATTPAWKTILVGGLNKGGRGYYALDVTDPNNPKGMWEFKGSSTCHAAGSYLVSAAISSDCDLGLSFGRPVVTKLVADGSNPQRWVVLVTSGYNNTTDGGNGKGHLFVLDAITGALIRKISTTGTGLKDVNTYVSNLSQNNTALRAYGGDLDGNIWRFDINDIYTPTGTEATLVGRATDASGNGQPITTNIELSEIGGKYMIFAGTGQLLNSDDLIVPTNAPVQSVYGFPDTAIGAVDTADPTKGAVAYPGTTLRTSLKPLKLVTNTDGTRSVQCNSTDSAVCDTKLAWRLDLPDNGERMNVDMRTAFTTLVFVSNVPTSTIACSVGGYSYFNYVDMITGQAVGAASSASTGVTSVKIAGSLSVGVSLIYVNPSSGGGSGGTDTGGAGGSSGGVKGLVTGADNSRITLTAPTAAPGPEGRRVSWREITQ